MRGIQWDIHPRGAAGKGSLRLSEEGEDVVGGVRLRRGHLAVDPATIVLTAVVTAGGSSSSYPEGLAIPAGSQPRPFRIMPVI